jgi:phytoene dehydrogenase-like protein
VAEALRQAAEAAGVSIVVGARAVAVVTDGTETRGVRLADGRVVAAPLVVSGIDPKATFALCDPMALPSELRWRASHYRAKGTLAKVNLISLAAARASFVRPDDLSLAGRLAKKTRLLYLRDDRARDDAAALLAAAADVIALAATLALPRVVSLEEASRRCFALSYQAEPRPETAAQIAARYQAFAEDYRARYEPRLAAAARARGIDVAGDSLVDRRPTSIRRLEARVLAWLLLRSRARTLARWSRQLLVYRGWLPYLVGKLRRTRSLRAATPAP